MHVSARSLRFLICAALLAACSGTAFAAPFVDLYSTNFDAFSTGDVNGQNGWTTFDPTFTTGGGNFAMVVNNAPTNAGQALRLTSGTGTSSSPRYAWPTNFGTAFTTAAASGEVVIQAQFSMYLASGQTSTARSGAVIFDDTGSKILSGFYVQANTGLVYLLANYNNAGTINNFSFNTNVGIGYDQWVNFTTQWNQTTGRMEVFWGANGFFVDGAAAGSVADEFDFYSTRNGSTISSAAYFDSLLVRTVSPVPEPSSYALAAIATGLTRLLARRRSKAARAA